MSCCFKTVQADSTTDPEYFPYVRWLVLVCKMIGNAEAGGTFWWMTLTNKCMCEVWRMCSKMCFSCKYNFTNDQKIIGDHSFSHRIMFLSCDHSFYTYFQNNMWWLSKEKCQCICIGLTQQCATHLFEQEPVVLLDMGIWWMMGPTYQIWVCGVSKKFGWRLPFCK